MLQSDEANGRRKAVSQAYFVFIYRRAAKLLIASDVIIVRR